MSLSHRPLEDTVVLVTRPAARASRLCERIRDAGGHPITLPMFTITPLRPAVPSGAAEIYIFLSPHAVEYGLPCLHAHDIAVNHAVVLAVGGATARALNDAGIRNVETPSENQAGSEGLLAMPGVQFGGVRARRVVLVCGAGGRRMLMEELRTRGVLVERLEVYRRDPVESDIAEAIRRAGSRWPDVIVITSVEGMENLARLIHAQEQERLFAVPLVVMSARIAGECRRCGFTAAAYVAPRASDDGLIAALLDHARTEKSR